MCQALSPDVLAGVTTDDSAPKHCECDHDAVLKPEWEGMYHPTLERPFVNHKPGECKCTNKLQQYERGDRMVWLCSCCC